MRTPNYLHLAPSGVYHYRRRHGGKVFSRSLHTRDRLTAQRLALAFAALYRADMEDLLVNLSNFEISTRPKGELHIKTNGTPKDNDAALKALQALRVAGVAAEAGGPQKAAQKATTASVKLGAAIKAWKAAIKPETLRKTYTQKSAAVDSFATHYGANKPVCDIGRVDVGNWLDALRAGGLSTPTLTNKASYLRGFCDYCRGRGWLVFDGDGNPAAGQISYSKSAKRLRRSAGFQPFTAAMVLALFNPEALASLSLSARWGAVIGLYSGARVAEVGQLALADIDAAASVPVFKINDGASGQSLKTESSRRVVPIHPDLVALGLLDRVAQLRAAGETRLFPAVKIGGVNGAGNWLSKAFSRHIKNQRVKVDKGRLGFHSLRKTYTQELQTLKVPSEYRAALEGHDLGDVHHSVYSRAPTIDELLQAVSPLSFGLDLEAIKRVLWDEKQKRQRGTKKSKK